MRQDVSRTTWAEKGGKYLSPSPRRTYTRGLKKMRVQSRAQKPNQHHNKKKSRSALTASNPAGQGWKGEFQAIDVPAKRAVALKRGRDHAPIREEEADAHRLEKAKRSNASGFAFSGSEPGFREKERPGSWRVRRKIKATEKRTQCRRPVGKKYKRTEPSEPGAIEKVALSPTENLQALAEN